MVLFSVLVLSSVGVGVGVFGVVVLFWVLFLVVGVGVVSPKITSTTTGEKIQWNVSGSVELNLKEKFGAMVDFFPGPNESSRV